jgi:hypothetical protein
MAVPTVGTSVFSPIYNSATTGTTNTTGFPVDMGIVRWATGTDSNYARSRLQGVSSNTTEGGAWLRTNSTAAESTSGGLTRLWNNTGFQTTSGFDGINTVYWNFGRAPGFFDVVAYTGTGASALTVTHNLQAVPELVILKYRQGTSYGWKVTATGLTNPNTYYLDLNGVNAEANFTADFIYNRTSTTFTVNGDLAQSGWNWIAYLFATCPGVSKVGTYMGQEAAFNVDCGFTSGARFILIKNISFDNQWYVWDSARGITSGNDPYLLLNSTAVQVSNTNYITTFSAGFGVASEAIAGSAINSNGNKYIFLAIA